MFYRGAEKLFVLFKYMQYNKTCFWCISKDIISSSIVILPATEKNNSS